jgi:mRNA-degrading endonuclease RelE of RelBE toxin-antitoxin system
MDIRKNIIDKYLNTKKNRLIAGCVTGLIVLGCGGGIVYATRDTSPKLQLKKNTINLEYGKEFKADFDTLVDTKGLNKEDKEYLKKNLKIKTDIKNDIETVTNEDGTTEEKDRGFAKVGDYKVNLTYKDETKTVKVVVKDTTAPEITAPENIEILQGTDLATFDFKSLIIATDLATMNELTVDYSTVDINVPAEYMVKASIEDTNGNRAEKDAKVTVIAPPAVAEDEVVVQETVTNADGTKTVKNTVKKKADSSGDKVVSSGNNSNSSSNSSGSKPSGSTGGSSGSSNSGSNKPSNGGTSGGSSSGGNSGNSGGSSGSGSGSGNTGSTGETTKKYIYVEWSYKVGDRTFNGSWAGREEKWNPNAMSLPNDAYDFSGFNKKSITYEEYKQIMGY